MEVKDYGIPKTPTSEQLYPNLNQEFPDETSVLNRIPPLPQENSNQVPIKPQPAPRNSIKPQKDGSKPIPRPRQFVPRKSSVIDNPVYFTVNVDESGDSSGDEVQLRRKKPQENDQELVLEFDPLAPGKCPLLEEQRRLKLTNSVFCLNVPKEHEVTYDSPVTTSVISVPDFAPVNEETNRNENEYIDQNNNDDDDDDVSYCSIDLEPPPFPPPPLPDGFSASSLSLNCTENEYEVEALRGGHSTPPARYAVVQPSSPTDKPALPPKLNRCHTPDSLHSSSANSSRGVSMISNASETSSCSFQFLKSNTDSLLPLKLESVDTPAPPLPPKSSKPSRTKSWNLVDIVRRSASFQKRHPGHILAESSQSHLKDSKNAKNVCFSGYLHKTGSNRKEFRQRWCVLENNHLKYYLDDKSEVPQGAVSQRDILSVGKVTDGVNAKNGPQEMHCFEVCTLKDKGRCYLFGSESKSDLELWMENIASTIGPKFIPIQNGKDFNKAGYVYLRYGISGKWQLAWICIEEKIFTTTLVSDERVETFDLRKVTSIQMHPVDKQQSCSKVIEDGSPFHLDFPGRSILIQANLRKETDSWYMLLRNIAQTTGKSLNSQHLTNDSVPVIVDKCISFVTIHGYTTEGIYRLNGVNSKITKLLEMLRQDSRGVVLKLDEYTVHDVASALKRFFRSLPEPLLTKSLYNQWISCSALPNQQEQLANYEHLLKLLPDVNLSTLKYVIGHLRNISDANDRNRMTVKNLASIFGPTLLTTESDDAVPNLINTNSEMDVVGDLISHYPVLFNVSAEELKKDMIIQKALMDIKEARRAKKPAGDILIGVYVYSPDWGKCLMIRLSPNLTAKDLCIYAMQNARMKEKFEYLSVYEVVCNGELERPLHYSEIVLAVTLQWARWADAEAKDNYLVIKKNELYHSILPLTRQPLSMFSELRYADRKAKHFKKFLLEFKNARLSFYRDVKITQPEGTWNIEDITWYLGCEAKRIGPTKWSFTFIDKSDEVKRSKERPYFGHTICCNTEEEFHKWIAAMLIGEYPNGLLAKKEVVNLLS